MLFIRMLTNLRPIMSDLPGSDMDERFAVALLTAARASRQLLDKRLSHLGTTQTGWLTIATIAKWPEPMSQRALADIVGIEGPSMVAALDRLEREGLVARLQTPADRRVKLIELTEAGRQLYGEVAREGASFRAWIAREFDRDSLAAATELIETVCKRLAAQL
jgi:MarR family transcriptional regulator for hemolysin